MTLGKAIVLSAVALSWVTSGAETNPQQASPEKALTAWKTEVKKVNLSYSQWEMFGKSWAAKDLEDQLSSAATKCSPVQAPGLNARRINGKKIAQQFRSSVTKTLNQSVFAITNAKNSCDLIDRVSDLEQAAASLKSTHSQGSRSGLISEMEFGMSEMTSNYTKASSAGATAATFFCGINPIPILARGIRTLRPLKMQSSELLANLRSLETKTRTLVSSLKAVKASCVAQTQPVPVQVSRVAGAHEAAR